MLIKPIPIGNMQLSPEELSADKKACIKYGPCGVGRKALYLGSFYISRRFYAVYPEIRRVFKRVAMSSGGFTGKGMFATIPYLVVVLKDGTEKQSNFKREEDVDKILEWVRKNHPEISTMTAKAEKEAAERESAGTEEGSEAAAGKAGRGERVVKTGKKQTSKGELSDSVKREIGFLKSDLRYLEEKPEISDRLSIAVRRKRIVDQMPKGSLLLISAIAVLGLLGLIGAVYAFAQKAPYAPYLLLFGAAFGFFALSTNALPIGQNSKKAAAKNWEAALAASREYTAGKRDFFLPAQYAHPIVIRRMLRILESGRASTRQDAYEVLKADLRALNSSVRVSQEEHDEVVIVKPLFLECGYSD